MNRLQKRCLVTSAGVHGLLIGVTVFGAAFFVPRERIAPTMPIKVYYPDQVVDKPTTSPTANLRASAPAAAVQTPAVTPSPRPVLPAAPEPVKVPEPVKTPEPTPAPETVFKEEPAQTPRTHHEPKKKREKPPPEEKPQPDPETKSDPKPDDATPPESEHGVTKVERRNHHVVIDPASLTPVTRGSTSKPDSRKQAGAEEQAAADARAEEEYQAGLARTAAARANARRRANEIGALARNLSGKSSSGTKVELAGPGGSNSFTANYGQIVAGVYDAAWQIQKPSSVSDKNPVVEVKVIIARDGRVIGKRILKSSGNPDMDRSIERVLESVKIVEAFPPGTPDLERSFNITFDLKAEQ